MNDLQMNPYQWIAAINVLEKWWLTGRLMNTKGKALACRANGVVWHDRYLCGDVREVSKRKSKVKGAKNDR